MPQLRQIENDDNESAASLLKLKVNLGNYPQVPRTKQRRVRTDTPPPHNREQLLQLDHSVQKYCGNLGGLAGRRGGNGAGLGSCLEVGRDTCFARGRFPRLIGSSMRPLDPLDSFVTNIALFSVNEFTETQARQISSMPQRSN